MSVDKANDTLKWRAFLDEKPSDDAKPDIDWTESLVGTWIDDEDNAESAVGTAVSRFLALSSEWENLMGEGEYFCTLVVEVAEPASCAGEYLVGVELQPRAKAQKL